MAKLAALFIKFKLHKHITRLYAIHDSVRLRVCNLYMARQNFMHTIKFLEWTLLHRSGT